MLFTELWIILLRGMLVSGLLFIASSGLKLALKRNLIEAIMFIIVNYIITVSRTMHPFRNELMFPANVSI